MIKKKAELLNKNENKEWRIKNYVNKTKTKDKKKFIIVVTTTFTQVDIAGVK